MRNATVSSEYLNEGEHLRDIIVDRREIYENGPYIQKAWKCGLNGADFSGLHIWNFGFNKSGECLSHQLSTLPVTSSRKTFHHDWCCGESVTFYSVKWVSIWELCLLKRCKTIATKFNQNSPQLTSCSIIHVGHTDKNLHRTFRLRGCCLCFVIGKSWVPLLTRKLAVANDGFLCVS